MKMECNKCRHHNKGHNCFPAARGTRCRGATEQLQSANEAQAAEIEELKAELDKAITLKKMCQAIVKYNENRHPNNEQFLVRRDMFKKIEQALSRRSPPQSPL